MQRTTRISTLSLIVFSAFLVSSSSTLPAAAPPDLTINVNVNVTKLSKSVDTLWLNCRLYTAGGADVGLGGGQGGTLPMPPDPTGAYNGILFYNWTFTNPADFPTAKKYKCTLQARGGPLTLPMDLVDGDGSKYYHLKPGTPRTLTAEGAIP